MLNAKTSNLMFLKTYNTDFDFITTTLTDQNRRPIEIEYKTSLTFLINK